MKLFKRNETLKKGKKLWKPNETLKRHETLKKVWNSKKGMKLWKGMQLLQRYDDTLKRHETLKKVWNSNKSMMTLWKAGFGIRLFTHSSFAQIAQIKWATVSDSLRLLRTNERLWVNCSGSSFFLFHSFIPFSEFHSFFKVSFLF